MNTRVHILDTRKSHKSGNPHGYWLNLIGTLYRGAQRKAIRIQRDRETKNRDIKHKNTLRISLRISLRITIRISLRITIRTHLRIPLKNNYKNTFKIVLIIILIW